MAISLENVSAQASLDPSGMLNQMIDLPSQLRASLSKEIDVGMEPRRLCIGGLGGSAMGGDVLCDHLSRVAAIPCAVSRDVALPNWVDATTLVILISYSGNTRETLAMYENARKKNAAIVAVTSGGRLMQACQECGEKVVIVPGGIQPRAALGYLLGSAAAVIEAAGVASVASELMGIVPAIEDRVRECSPQTSQKDNEAKRIAERVVGKMPFVYASRNVRTAAKRWQTQINENSKMLCLSGELPEADHNQVVGWLDGVRDNRNVPIFLKAPSEQGMMASIVDATIAIFEDFKLDPIITDLKGGTALENTMDGIVLGDFVSYYLAMLKGIDPTPVSSITELKKRLG